MLVGGWDKELWRPCPLSGQCRGLNPTLVAFCRLQVVLISPPVHRDGFAAVEYWYRPLGTGMNRSSRISILQVHVDPRLIIRWPCQNVVG